MARYGPSDHDEIGMPGPFGLIEDRDRGWRRSENSDVLRHLTRENGAHSGKFGARYGQPLCRLGWIIHHLLTPTGYASTISASKLVVKATTSLRSSSGTLNVSSVTDRQRMKAA